MPLEDSIYSPGATSTNVDFRPYHVILTRFNLRIFRERRGLSDAVSVRDWVSSRIEIFRDVCLPSVISQTWKPQRWYIGVDGTYPDLVRPLAELCADVPWIVLTYQGPDDRHGDVFRRPLSADVAARGDRISHVVTTRLDCDDAISVDYSMEMRKYVSAILGRSGVPEDFWISFPLGAQLVEEEFGLYVETRNHFLTRVTRARSFGSQSTALDGNHSKVFESGLPVYLPMTQLPMWLQNVHGGNVLNQAARRSYALRPAGELWQRFGRN